ncbi:1,3-beta-galactosyl-N-acetylhexosamine phosphorylase [Bifidobacterium sp. ESL0728]|uniref:1,3-beta-galactosyl-N-acetylhexosamine phosphorylase n=1 Tax=Bifidobacterium sp. ESL0728 TaxID=2983220 RepID=UPI0023F8C14D|nr:1,3-beta-galactosyl-N-acetylhexosamine phosphorylase [Bifidobacterium sp. ESL0728]WEV58780.1 1,3-beta-galactosyl-N-acetylhexosamine phosphorylase [Bifidobacterium sp. ESL0728]
MASTGRFTIPTQEHFAKKTIELANLWGADAIRNSDGTHLDDEVVALGKKVYSAYFPCRAHNEWITLHMDETPQVYLLSQRVLATSGTVHIPFMDTFFSEQLKPNYDADPSKYWEVIDRTTGQVIPPKDWSLKPEENVAVIRHAVPMHEYTVSFLAYIIWDPVEMYNHLTNDWGDKEHEIPFDIYHPATRKFVFDTFNQWLKDNPEVDVVRFTTFFYQFTLLFDQHHREKVVDWFGSACTVSPQALEDFAVQYGYRLRPEDFVDEGCYDSSFRIPRKAQRDWLDFLSRFVRRNVKKLVSMTHEAGKEAMMFLGDQWIGTEPYMDGFGDLGLDAVVGSVGDGTTTRMISDIKGVKYTEGRFLPYFFPDTFYEGNDPSIEAWSNWRKARRAILRSPLDRMGYGGYLSLAAKFPKFVDAVTHIANQFRDLSDKTQGKPAVGDLNVAILNSWGKMRSWMAYTVAHSLPIKQTYSFYGILEALSGMRVNVRFISFNDVLACGIDPDIDVIINAGSVNTSFTGGDVWKDDRLIETMRSWVREGGAFVGVGEPSSLWWQGRFFQLADVLGIDEERFQTLSVDKYFPEVAARHFITADVPAGETVDFGEPIVNTYPVNEQVTLLKAEGGQVQLAANDYGKGRGVYISGLPYSAANARLLERALFWGSHKEAEYEAYSSSNPQCEVARFPETGWYCVVNNTDEPQSTDVRVPQSNPVHFDIEPNGIVWNRL